MHLIIQSIPQLILLISTILVPFQMLLLDLLIQISDKFLKSVYLQLVLSNFAGELSVLFDCGNVLLLFRIHKLLVHFHFLSQSQQVLLHSTQLGLLVLLELLPLLLLRDQRLLQSVKVRRLELQLMGEGGHFREEVAVLKGQFVDLRLVLSFHFCHFIYSLLNFLLLHPLLSCH